MLSLPGGRENWSPRRKAVGSPLHIAFQNPQCSSNHYPLTQGRLCQGDAEIFLGRDRVVLPSSRPGQGRADRESLTIVGGPSWVSCGSLVGLLWVPRMHRWPLGVVVVQRTAPEEPIMVCNYMIPEHADRGFIHRSATKNKNCLSVGRMWASCWCCA
jgi:hypothetical protein